MSGENFHDYGRNFSMQSTGRASLAPALSPDMQQTTNLQDRYNDDDNDWEPAHPDSASSTGRYVRANGRRDPAHAEEGGMERRANPQGGNRAGENDWEPARPDSSSSTGRYTRAYGRTDLAHAAEGAMERSTDLDSGSRAGENVWEPARFDSSSSTSHLTRANRIRDQMRGPASNVESSTSLQGSGRAGENRYGSARPYSSSRFDVESMADLQDDDRGYGSGRRYSQVSCADDPPIKGIRGQRRDADDDIEGFPDLQYSDQSYEPAHHHSRPAFPLASDGSTRAKGTRGQRHGSQDNIGGLPELQDSVGSHKPAHHHSRPAVPFSSYGNTRMNGIWNQRRGSEGGTASLSSLHDGDDNYQPAHHHSRSAFQSSADGETSVKAVRDEWRGLEGAIGRNTNFQDRDSSEQAARYYSGSASRSASDGNTTANGLRDERRVLEDDIESWTDLQNLQDGDDDYQPARYHSQSASRSASEDNMRANEVRDQRRGPEDGISIGTHLQGGRDDHNPAGPRSRQLSRRNTPANSDRRGTRMKRNDIDSMSVLQGGDNAHKSARLFRSSFDDNPFASSCRGEIHGPEDNTDSMTDVQYGYRGSDNDHEPARYDSWSSLDHNPRENPVRREMRILDDNIESMTDLPGTSRADRNRHESARLPSQSSLQGNPPANTTRRSEHILGHAIKNVDTFQGSFRVGDNGHSPAQHHSRSSFDNNPRANPAKRPAHVLGGNIDTNITKRSRNQGHTSNDFISPQEEGAKSGASCEAGIIDDQNYGYVQANTQRRENIDRPRRAKEQQSPAPVETEYPEERGANMDALYKDRIDERRHRDAKFNDQDGDYPTMARNVTQQRPGNERATSYLRPSYPDMRQRTSEEDRSSHRPSKKDEKSGAEERLRNTPVLTKSDERELATSNTARLATSQRASPRKSITRYSLGASLFERGLKSKSQGSIPTEKISEPVTSTKDVDNEGTSDVFSENASEHENSGAGIDNAQNKHASTPLDEVAPRTSKVHDNTRETRDSHDSARQVSDNTMPPPTTLDAEKSPPQTVEVESEADRALRIGIPPPYQFTAKARPKNNGLPRYDNAPRGAPGTTDRRKRVLQTVQKESETNDRSPYGDFSFVSDHQSFGGVTGGNATRKAGVLVTTGHNRRDLQPSQEDSEVSNRLLFSTLPSLSDMQFSGEVAGGAGREQRKAGTPGNMSGSTQDDNQVPQPSIKNKEASKGTQAMRSRQVSIQNSPAPAPAYPPQVAGRLQISAEQVAAFIVTDTDREIYNYRKHRDFNFNQILPLLNRTLETNLTIDEVKRRFMFMKAKRASGDRDAFNPPPESRTRDPPPSRDLMALLRATGANQSSGHNSIAAKAFRARNEAEKAVDDLERDPEVQQTQQMLAKQLEAEVKKREKAEKDAQELRAADELRKTQQLASERADAEKTKAELEKKRIEDEKKRLEDEEKKRLAAIERAKAEERDREIEAKKFELGERYRAAQEQKREEIALRNQQRLANNAKERNAKTGPMISTSTGFAFATPNNDEDVDDVPRPKRRTPAKPKAKAARADTKDSTKASDKPTKANAEAPTTDAATGRSKQPARTRASRAKPKQSPAEIPAELNARGYATEAGKTVFDINVLKALYTQEDVLNDSAEDSTEEEDTTPEAVLLDGETYNEYRVFRKSWDSEDAEPGNSSVAVQCGAIHTSRDGANAAAMAEIFEDTGDDISIASKGNFVFEKHDDEGLVQLEVHVQKGRLKVWVERSLRRKPTAKRPKLDAADFYQPNMYLVKEQTRSGSVEAGNEVLGDVVDVCLCTTLSLANTRAATRLVDKTFYTASSRIDEIKAQKTDARYDLEAHLDELDKQKAPFCEERVNRSGQSVKVWTTQILAEGPRN